MILLYDFNCYIDLICNGPTKYRIRRMCQLIFLCLVAASSSRRSLSISSALSCVLKSDRVSVSMHAHAAGGGASQ